MPDTVHPDLDDAAATVEVALPPALPASVLAILAARAEAEDRGTARIDGSVAALRACGTLREAGRGEDGIVARRLMRIAGVNLSLARLYEGHVNALRLIRAHGTPAQHARVAAMVEDGAFLGVWGADGDRPLVREGDSLRGAKVYTSGLGTVTHALVSVGGLDETRLALVPAGEAARQDAAAWAMPGMRATASGRYDFDGVAARDALWIGGPGDYGREPTFVGGVWRIAAIQAGAAIGLLDAAVRRLTASGRLDAEAQMIRLAACFIDAFAAREAVLRAAAVAEGPAGAVDPERAVCLSAAVRLLTEGLGQRTIAAVEQSVGLAHFAEGSVTGRMARDLAVYMRQAARDAFLLRVGRKAFAADSLWDALA